VHTENTADAHHVLTHELLHAVSGWQDPALWADPVWRAREEGFTEAVALDVLPGMRRRQGITDRDEFRSAYWVEVAQARMTSTVGSGSACWRAPAAVRWRARYLLGGDALRAFMLGRAETRRLRWPPPVRPASPDRRGPCRSRPLRSR
jgi:hypothetical protein